MGNQDYQKATCTHCGGRIEFPVNVANMTVECPHCHQQTELHATQKPRRNISRLLIFAVLGIALTAVALFVLKSQKSEPVATPLPVASNAIPDAAAIEPARPKSADDLKVVGEVSIEKAKGSRLSYAMGTLKNNSDHPRYGVKMEIDLFDKAGNKLPGQANDYLQMLEPRKEWKFRALVVDSKATTAKIASIKEED